MNFEVSEDRRMLADTLARFIADRYRIEQRNAIAYSTPGFSLEAWNSLVELGALSALFPECHGGTWEFALSHYAKRLVMIDHQLGDEDHHLGRYVALRERCSDARVPLVPAVLPVASMAAP